MFSTQKTDFTTDFETNLATLVPFFLDVERLKIRVKHLPFWPRCEFVHVVVP